MTNEEIIEIRSKYLTEDELKTLYEINGGRL